MTDFPPYPDVMHEPEATQTPVGLQKNHQIIVNPSKPDLVSAFWCLVNW